MEDTVIENAAINEFPTIGEGKFWKNERDELRQAFFTGAMWQKEQTGWIKCSERLPDIGERVLVYAPNSHAIFMVAYRNMRGTWKNSNGNYVHGDSDFITHWMPLPDKPQQL